jgi:hypothetical protein
VAQLLRVEARRRLVVKEERRPLVVGRRHRVDPAEQRHPVAVPLLYQARAVFHQLRVEPLLLVALAGLQPQVVELPRSRVPVACLRRRLARRHLVVQAAFLQRLAADRHNFRETGYGTWCMHL